MTDEAKNLEAIQRAVVQHNGNCPFPLVQIEMNHHEVERLGWEDFRGIPIVGTDQVGTGRFKLICETDLPGGDRDEAEKADRDKALTGLTRVGR